MATVITLAGTSHICRLIQLVTTAPMHNLPSSESIRASSVKRNINSKSNSHSSFSKPYIRKGGKSQSKRGRLFFSLQIEMEIAEIQRFCAKEPRRMREKSRERKRLVGIREPKRRHFVERKVLSSRSQKVVVLFLRFL